MNSAHPWPSVRVGDVLKLTNGRAFKPSEWQLTGRPIIRIQNLNNPSAPFNYYGGELPEKFVVNSGDLLFAWSGTPGTSFGAHIWRGERSWLNQHIFKIGYDAKQFDPRFLVFAINQNLADYIRAAHGGAGLAHITKGRFEASYLPCPALPEQQRIVAEIEKQFTRLDAAVRAMNSVEAKLIGYRSVILTVSCEAHSAATGMLPEGWAWSSLRSLLREPLRNGHSAKAASDGHGLRAFTLSAVTEGDFSEKNTKITVASHHKVRDLWAEPGDIYVERANTPELVGTARLYRGARHFAFIPDLLIRVRVRPDVLPEYVELALQTERARNYFRSRAQGISGSMPKIDQQAIEEAAIPLPPPSEQSRIVADIRRHFDAIDVVKRGLETNLKRARSLRQSILQRAFSGQL